MSELPYRTGSTWLTDDDLIVLDVMFDVRVSRACLARDGFELRWNLKYSHGYNNLALAQRLRHFEEVGVIHSPNPDIFEMTPNGGALWSQERCPLWERFCIDRYHYHSDDLVLLSVVAVSEDIRDKFLEWWPIYPARRRKVTIRNYELVPWKEFSHLYVGLAFYHEPSSWGDEGWRASHERELSHYAMLETARPWWRMVSELQKLLPPSSDHKSVSSE